MHIQRLNIDIESNHYISIKLFDTNFINDDDMHRNLTSSILNIHNIYTFFVYKQLHFRKSGRSNCLAKPKAARKIVIEIV